ncbi:hypothetical protein Cpir12675_001334 [Ceratocystis pirilliformis]|uniref:Uncharacterized protein n=1 Tax=Ceratocystis pirilliformis TaxID=259994 RepID=A0ABR3ZG54_9PEZI
MPSAAAERDPVCSTPSCPDPDTLQHHTSILSCVLTTYKLDSSSPSNLSFPNSGAQIVHIPNRLKLTLGQGRKRTSSIENKESTVSHTGKYTAGHEETRAEAVPRLWQHPEPSKVSEMPLTENKMMPYHRTAVPPNMAEIKTKLVQQLQKNQICNNLGTRDIYAKDNDMSFITKEKGQAVLPESEKSLSSNSLQEGFLMEYDRHAKYWSSDDYAKIIIEEDEDKIGTHKCAEKGREITPIPRNENTATEALPFDGFTQLSHFDLDIFEELDAQLNTCELPCPAKILDHDETDDYPISPIRSSDITCPNSPTDSSHHEGGFPGMCELSQNEMSAPTPSDYFDQKEEEKIVLEACIEGNTYLAMGTQGEDILRQEGVELNSLRVRFGISMDRFSSSVEFGRELNEKLL